MGTFLNRRSKWTGTVRIQALKRQGYLSSSKKEKRKKRKQEETEQEDKEEDNNEYAEEEGVDKEYSENPVAKPKKRVREHKQWCAYSTGS